LQVFETQKLLETNGDLQRLLELRHMYVDPLNLLQVILLKKFRDGAADDGLTDALSLSIQGIAAGMHNTG
jgi:phosphoenolpyruvate carboxylase